MRTLKKYLNIKKQDKVLFQTRIDTKLLREAKKKAKKDGIKITDLISVLLKFYMEHK